MAGLKNLKKTRRVQVGDGQGMVGQGRYVNGQFEAVEILARHDESYIPKEVIDALKEQGTYVAPPDA